MMGKARMKSRGFTLIELMVVIAIAAVMIAIAVPSFQNYAASQRVRSAAADLTMALNFARSEAVKRNGEVSVSKLATQWNEGWSVKSGATTLKEYSAPDGVAITASNTVTPTYNRDGRLGVSAVNFTVAASNGTTTSRCVKVATSGKASNTSGGC
jgi:type IV fimbrial biogenesis protein FimT